MRGVRSVISAITQARRCFPAHQVKLSPLIAVVLAVTLGGCARQESASAKAHPQSQACRSERALLAPQRPPDCEFKASDLQTVDAEEFARLKLAYERQCYQRAEKAARERLRRLQVSRQCEVRSRRADL